MKIDLVKKYGYRVVYTEIDPALFNKEFDNPEAIFSELNYLYDKLGKINGKN